MKIKSSEVFKTALGTAMYLQTEGNVTAKISTLKQLWVCVCVCVCFADTLGKGFSTSALLTVCTGLRFTVGTAPCIAGCLAASLAATH